MKGFNELPREANILADLENLDKKWIKKALLEDQLRDGIISCKEEYYYGKVESPIANFTIIKLVRTQKYRISLTMFHPNLYQTLSSKFMAFKIFTSMKLISFGSPQEVNAIEVSPIHQKYYKNFILAIDQVLNFEPEVKQRIFDTLEIKVIVEFDKFVSELKMLVEQGNFTEALVKAQATGVYKAILSLGHICEVLEEWPWVEECYKLLRKIGNQKYRNIANLELASIITNMLNEYKKNNIPITDAEFIAYSERRLKYLLSISDLKEQSIIDCFFENYIEGKECTHSPSILNVKFNIDTILMLGREIKKLRQENKQYKKEIESYQKSNRELLQQLKETSVSNIEVINKLDSITSSTTQPYIITDSKNKTSSLDTDTLPRN